MLKPFYNKKKNIDDRLLPAVTVDDAGKFLGVTEDGKFAPVEGADFSLIRGKNIELTVSNNVLSAVTIDNVSIAPSDFFDRPYVDILLSLSYITIVGLRINNESVSFYFDNGRGYFNVDQLWIGGLYTYNTPDGSGLGSGTFLISREGLEVNFDPGYIFITP